MVRMAAGTSLRFCMAFASQQFWKVSETQGQDPSQGISTRCLLQRPGDASGFEICLIARFETLEQIIHLSPSNGFWIVINR